MFKAMMNFLQFSVDCLRPQVSCKVVCMCGSRDFFRGSAPDGQKTAWTTIFLILFSVLNLFYRLQMGSNGFTTE